MSVVARPGDLVPGGLPGTQVHWGAHVCQLYRDERELLEVLVPFFAAGLANRERCIWITAPELRADDARAALAAMVPDSAEYEARRQLVIVDRSAWPEAHGDLLADWIARERAALADGYRGLRITGSPTWRETHELRNATVFAGHRIIALCSYRLADLAPDEIVAILRDHQGGLVRRGGEWEHVTSATAALALLESPPHAQPVLVHPHRVEFFDHRAFPASAIVERIGDALLRGDGAIMLATNEHLSALRAGLADRVALDELLADGRVMFVDADAVWDSLDGNMAASRLDEKLGTLVRDVVTRCGRVRAYGELVDVACRHGKHDSAIALERWWNGLIARLPVELDCGYSVQSFNHASTLGAFRSICEQHAAVDTASEHHVDPGRLAAELQQVTSLLDIEAQRRIALEAAYEGSRHAERGVREHLVLLQRITAALADALTVEQIGEVVTDEVMTAFGATRIALEVRGQLITLRGVTTPDDSTGVAAALQQLPAMIVRLANAPDELRWFAGATTVVSPVALHGTRSGTLALAVDRDGVSAPQRALLDDVVCQLATAIERARAIAEVHQLRHKAEAANAAKDRFLAMLGHELRNPLSPILMATQLMRVRAPESFPKERATIERSVSNMIRLVDDLLEVTRITRGKLELARTPVELSQVVAQALERASSAIEGRSHSLRVSIPSGLFIEVDGARFAQALSNVLVNAAKYMRPGGIIELDAEGRGGEVMLAVVDHGVGIPAELLPHVFDLFVQGDQSADRVHGGLGVGLAIARSIIELHGGAISAASAGADAGSAFTITLPRWVAPEAARVLEPANQRQRILVVDDNQDAALLLAEALELLGHEVRVSHDGESGLELARLWSPQLAFCDLGLPGMDGFELARELQQLPVRPRLIALTGYDHSSARAQSRAAGFDLHLIKPVGLREIQTAIAPLPGR
jgi:signal transduction histidine kinase